MSVWRSTLAGLLLAAVCSQMASAQSDVIKARRDNFHTLSDEMREVIKGLGDGVPTSALRARVAAASAALERAGGLFPAGSGEGRTKALPAIWSEPERFAAVYATAQLRMRELVAASLQPDRDAFGAAAGRMASACGSCHGAFRAE